MSQVRRHDNVQLGPEDLLLSIVGGPGEEAVSIFKMVIASGWRPWRARLTPQTHGGFSLPSFQSRRKISETPGRSQELAGRGGGDAKKGNHGPRRTGYHGSIGNGANRARAASTATPTTHSHGRYQEAFGRRL